MHPETEILSLTFGNKAISMTSTFYPVRPKIKQGNVSNIRNMIQSKNVYTHRDIGVRGVRQDAVHTSLICNKVIRGLEIFTFE